MPGGTVQTSDAWPSAHALKPSASYRAVVGSRRARRQCTSGSLAKYMLNATHANPSIPQRTLKQQPSHGGDSVSRALA
jgi:hypothetical protein